MNRVLKQRMERFRILGAMSFVAFLLAGFLAVQWYPQAQVPNSPASSRPDAAPSAETPGQPSPPAASRQASLPTTEEFMNSLGTCAGCMNLKLSADLRGSMRSVYEGATTQGTATLQNAPEFLRSFPENERAIAYKIYVECVTKILK